MQDTLRYLDMSLILSRWVELKILASLAVEAMFALAKQATAFINMWSSIDSGT